LKEKIIRIVEENYTDSNFDVNKLAELLGICRNYLNTKCQFEFDCTPHNLIEDLRIEKAKTLLLEGKKIIQVCKKAGYANKKSFYSAFKKITNMTPGEFVKNNTLQNYTAKLHTKTS